MAEQTFDAADLLSKAHAVREALASESWLVVGKAAKALAEAVVQTLPPLTHLETSTGEEGAPLMPLCPAEEGALTDDPTKCTCIACLRELVSTYSGIITGYQRRLEAQDKPKGTGVTTTPPDPNARTTVGPAEGLRRNPGYPASMRPRPGHGTAEITHIKLIATTKERGEEVVVDAPVEDTYWEHNLQVASGYKLGSLTPVDNLHTGRQTIMLGFVDTDAKATFEKAMNESGFAHTQTNW